MARNTNRARRVSLTTARLLGYRTVAEVPFKIRGPHGAPVHERPTYTIKPSGERRMV